MLVLAGPYSMHGAWLSLPHLVFDVQLWAALHSCAPAERLTCCPWVADLWREEDSKTGTAPCCRESPAHQWPAQVCYRALTSAKPTGKKTTGHMTALPRPGLPVPKQPPIFVPPSWPLQRWREQPRRVEDV